MKVAMLTTFVGYMSSYSLCYVAKIQLRMLKKAGYDVRFICRGGGDQWKQWADDIKEIPDYICENDGSSGPVEKRTGKSVDEMATETYWALCEHLKDIDVIITHDLIYQSSNNIQDIAASRFAKEHADVKFLHWIHSATSPRDLNKQKRNQYPNAQICYPNAYDVPRVASNFGFENVDVKVVPHPMDYVDYYGMHPITEKLIDEKDILSAEVLGAFPLRLDRGKQPEMCIKIFNQIKHHFNRTIRLIIVDFHSTGGDKATFRNEMKDMAIKMGWNDHEITFMSEFDKSCELETPREVVRDLFILSNLYIHPSKSETYSLTTQEARASKNMLILNYDFPAMQSIYKDGPLYKKFSSCVNMLDGSDGATNTEYPKGEDAFMIETAGNALYHLDHQSVLAMSTETRQTKNPKYVFKKYIEPLFFSPSK